MSARSPAANAWLRQFDQDLRDKNYEGWFVPGLLDMVCSRGRHEIASHGFTHLPFDETVVTAEDADRRSRGRSPAWAHAPNLHLSAKSCRARRSLKEIRVSGLSRWIRRETR